MSKMLRIISALVLLCLICNTAVPNLVFSQTFNYPNKWDKLAPSSIFGDLIGIEHQDVARIELALEGRLLHSAGKDNAIDIVKLIEGAGAYRDSIFKLEFQFETPDLFVNEIEGLPNGCYRVMCRIYDERHGKRTYYAVFPGTKDGDGGFPIEVYTENEWKVKGVEKFIKDTKSIPRRMDDRPQDAERVNRYKENNEKAISVSIRDYMKDPDNFAEIAGRAGRLGWDERYKTRVRPSHYWTEEFFTLLDNRLREFLGIFGTSVGDAFEGKNIVFIKLPPGVDYPPITEDGREVPVRARSSNNAVYLFLLNGDFDFFERAFGGEVPSEALNSRAFRRLEEALVHEVGAICGLSFDVEDSGIVNDLDRAFLEYHDYIAANYGQAAKGPLPPRQELLDHVRRKFSKIESLNPVDLDELTGINASGQSYERDYAATGQEQPAENFVNELKAAAASEDEAKLRAFLDGVVAGGLLREGLFYDACAYLSGYAPEEAEFIAGIIQQNPSLAVLVSEPEGRERELVRSMLENSLDLARFQHHEYRLAKEVNFKNSRLSESEICQLKTAVSPIRQTCQQNLDIIEGIEDPECLYRVYARLARIRQEEARVVTPMFVVFGKQKARPWQAYLDAYMRAVKERYGKVTTRLETGGLVVNREIAEAIIIDKRVRVAANSKRGSEVKLLVDAPADVEIYRYDVYTDIEWRMRIEASRLGRKGGGRFVIKCDCNKYFVLKIGDEIVRVLVARPKSSSHSNKVKFVINAPRDISVDRENIAEAKARETAQAAAAVIKTDAPHVGDQIWHKGGKYNLILPFEFFGEGDFTKHVNRYGNRFDLVRVGGITGEMDDFIKNVLAKVKPGSENRTVVLVPQANDLRPQHLDELGRAGLRYVIMRLGDINVANNPELKSNDGERLRFQEHVYDVMLLFRYLDEETLRDPRVHGVAGAYIGAYFEFMDGRLTVETFIEAIKRGDAAQLIKGVLSYRQFRCYDAVEEHRAVSAPLVFA